MRILGLTVIVAGFVVLGWAPVVSADQIVLDNGDRISGKIIKISAGEVVLETEYAGEICVDFGRVVNMNTERPVRITLREGDVITGRVDSIFEESIIIDSELFGLLEAERSALVGLAEPGTELKVEQYEKTRQALEETEESLKRTQEALKEKEEEVAKLSSGAGLWDGSLSLGAALQRGNTDTSDFRLEAKAARTVPREELSLRFHMDYGETDGEADTNETFGAVKLKVFQTDRRYIFGLMDAEYDEFENLDLRLQAFAGPGYIFIDNENTKLLGEIGAGPIGEFVDTETGTESTVEANLWLHTEWSQKVYENVLLTTAFTLFPSLGDFGEYRAKLESSLRTPVQERWFLKVSLIDDYDSDPEEDVENNDVKFITSLETIF